MRTDSLARAERAGLVADLERTGPDAPTLCTGWDAAHLAAHLVLRERRPDAALGVLARPLSGHTERVQESYARRPWGELLGLLAAGPPALSPMRLPYVHGAANTVEMFVHHEDLRRAQDGWVPRALDPALDEALWSAVRRQAPLLLRRVDVGVVLRRETGRETGEETVGRRGDPSVVVTGAPGELVLLVYGRKGHARVSVDGDPEAVRRLAAAPLGV